MKLEYNQTSKFKLYIKPADLFLFAQGYTFVQRMAREFLQTFAMTRRDKVYQLQ